MATERATPLNSGNSPSPRALTALAHALIVWFKESARDLPWRRTRDPYAIWISEVMLQQTQVATVIPYWERWMRELPDLRSLAAAPAERVLKLWEGLGYYSRARHLQQAACHILKHHAGRFPSRHPEILALPGVGPYTAGALCSLAYDQPEPILDGNITRVFTRLFAWRDDPRTATMRSRLWSMAARLVTAASSLHALHSTPHSTLNQSLMELGATVCTPRAPRCEDCPLRRRCQGRKLGLAAQLPMTRPRPTPEERRQVVILVQQGERYWLWRRPTHGVVNAGLWEFPNLEVQKIVPNELTSWLQRWFDPGKAPLAMLGRLTHHITRYRHRLTVFRLSIHPSHRVHPAEGVWRSPAELEQLPLAGAHRKILRQFVVDNRR